VRTTQMAKKPKSKAPASDRPSIAVTLRGSQEWKAWIEAGARFCRTDVAKLLDSAVVDYLKARGFDQPAPER
jgi:hypothetical protein